MKMRMNNAAIKAYEVEDGPIKKIVINIDIDELDKHPEILGQETTNGLKILNLMSYCSVDLKTAYEYAEGSESLTAVVDNIYETFKNLLGYDVAESAKRLGVDGYVMALNRKERLIANELARFTNDDPATLKDKLNDIVNLLAAGASIEEMAKKTHTPEGMIKIYLQELKKQKEGNNISKNNIRINPLPKGKLIPLKIDFLFTQILGDFCLSLYFRTIVIRCSKY